MHISIHKLSWLPELHATIVQKDICQKQFILNFSAVKGVVFHCPLLTPLSTVVCIKIWLYVYIWQVIWPFSSIFKELWGGQRMFDLPQAHPLPAPSLSSACHASGVWLASPWGWFQRQVGMFPLPSPSRPHHPSRFPLPGPHHPSPHLKIGKT